MKKAIVFLFAGLLSAQANAAFYCDVSMKNILIYKDGTVNVLHSGVSNYTFLCNMNVERQGVTPTVCAMWTGMLQQIKKKNGTAIFYYEGTSTCAQLPTYDASPAPFYIGDSTV